MLRTSPTCLAVVGAAALALSGCGGPSVPDVGPPSTAAEAASAPVATAGTTAAASLPGDHFSSKRYRIDIDYPQLPPADAVLVATLHRAGARAKQKFLRALPDPKQYPGLANRQFLLKLDFSIAAQMPAFVSVRERGMADTGGAHPFPVDASFVYDTRAGKIITLDDLFRDPAQARQHLAKVARKALDHKLLAKVPGGKHTTERARKEWLTNMRGMIAEGTQPTRKNLSEFVVLAGAGDGASGLLLIFPPAQVAPYVYGSQTVEVPVDVFAHLLKPEYRGDFDTAES